MQTKHWDNAVNFLTEQCKLLHRTHGVIDNINRISLSVSWLRSVLLLVLQYLTFSSNHLRSSEDFDEVHNYSLTIKECKNVRITL